MFSSILKTCPIILANVNHLQMLPVWTTNKLDSYVNSCIPAATLVISYLNFGTLCRIFKRLNTTIEREREKREREEKERESSGLCIYIIQSE